MAISNFRYCAGEAAAEHEPDLLPLPAPVNEIRVGMGDIATAREPCTLTIIGLGSCVGVALYSQKDRIGGLAHIMLPDSSKARNSTSREKFADTGLEILLDQVKKRGADPFWMTARLVGGASMFKSSGLNCGGTGFNIGENNVHACREFLRKERIRIVGEEVLGSAGRTMRFDLSTGKIYVRFADGNGLEL